MDCASHRIPLGIWRLRIYHQLLSTSQRSQPHRSFSSKTRQNQSQDGASIPPSQRLPQSPLLTRLSPGSNQKPDPKLMPEKAGLEPLAKNPWALALASPMRTCSLSGARMPRALMGEWGLVRKPNTEEMYLLPVDLLRESLEGRNTKGQNQSQNAAAAEDNSPMKARKEKFGRQLVFLMTNFMSSLRAISKPLGKTGGKKPAVSRLIPFRWKHPQGPITAREERQLVWMDNMPEYMLRHMRSKVVKQLVAACLKSNHLGAANRVWSAIEMQVYSHSALSEALDRLEPMEQMECGAVILLGGHKNENSSGSFPKSVILSQNQRGVPVFDLSTLLSHSDLAKLREAVPHFHQSALFFRPNNKAVSELMLSLWKLKQFLENDKGFEGV
ncbi:uncharacterized protein N7484_007162 [Penicillium longicatenatum]|uniref:uncharacterized protein n=1 Tax=Penicillium longicatenatum TaxID=1561947 RepID=UPI002548DD2A|nr:uncharacterized protein N7484_007162 [Penicillium longicatenatum]KAJ5639300.1 hypothetical protein N7484_007162 [Penicillium longicatenatum]